MLFFMFQIIIRTAELAKYRAEMEPWNSFNVIQGWNVKDFFLIWTCKLSQTFMVPAV